jgi:hypothetical protein
MTKKIDGIKIETPQTLEILVGEEFEIEEKSENDPQIIITNKYIFGGIHENSIILYMINTSSLSPVGYVPLYYSSTLETTKDIKIRIPDIKGTIRFNDPSDYHEKKVMKSKYDSIIITYTPPKKEQKDK